MRATVILSAPRRAMNLSFPSIFGRSDSETTYCETTISEVLVMQMEAVTPLTVQVEVGMKGSINLNGY